MQSSTFRRAMSAAILGGGLAFMGLTGTPAAAQIDHAIEDAGFDDYDVSGPNWGYVREIQTDYAWSQNAAGDNVNPWIYNTAYAAATPVYQSPRSSDNAMHLGHGSLFQILDDTFVAGRTYTLSAYIGHQLDEPVEDQPFGLRLFDGNDAGFVGNWFEMTPIASGDYTLGVDYFADDAWHLVSLEYTATEDDHGKAIGIMLGNNHVFVEVVNGNNVTRGHNNISIDDVSLTSIPEPGTAMIAGLGALAYVWGSGRRRRRA